MLRVISLAMLLQAGPAAAAADPACAGAEVARATAVRSGVVAAGVAVRPSLIVSGEAHGVSGGVDAPGGVVLSGVVLPGAAGAGVAAALRERLSALAGMPVRVLAGRDARDRRGRVVGQVMAGPAGAEVWLQAVLVDAGLAIASVEEERDGPGCTAELMAAEAGARAARRGVWAAPGFVRAANGRADEAVLAGLPDFVVMEGRVVSVGNAGATTYLNFGRWFRTDATVRIARRNSADFPADKDPSGLVGVAVRVRGWAEASNGIDLPVSSAAAIERIEERRGDRRGR